MDPGAVETDVNAVVCWNPLRSVGSTLEAGVVGRVTSRKLFHLVVLKPFLGRFQIACDELSFVVAKSVCALVPWLFCLICLLEDRQSHLGERQHRMTRLGTSKITLRSHHALVRFWHHRPNLISIQNSRLLIHWRLRNRLLLSCFLWWLVTFLYRLEWLRSDGVSLALLKTSGDVADVWARYH